jgi:hypothetical protein
MMTSKKGPPPTARLAGIAAELAVYLQNAIQALQVIAKIICANT